MCKCVSGGTYVTAHRVKWHISDVPLPPCKCQPLSNHTPLWSDTSLVCHCHCVWCCVKAVLFHISDRWKAIDKEHCLRGKMLKWWGPVPCGSAYSVTTLPSGSDGSVLSGYNIFMWIGQQAFLQRRGISTLWHWVTLHYKELHDLRRSQHVIEVINWKKKAIGSACGTYGEKKKCIGF